MVTSVLMGSPDGKVLRRVYPAEVREALCREAGLNTEIILGKDNIAEHGELAAKAAFAFSTWGMPAFSEEEIKNYFPLLRAVFYAAGSVQGFARPFLRCGVRMFSAWAANAVPVAEYTVSQIILADKGFFASCARMSRGDVDGARRAAASFPGTYGCTVGILGAGMVGSLVIRMLKAYRVRVLVFDPFLAGEKAKSLGVEKCSLEEVFRQSQTISNHLANNPQTEGMLNYRLFSQMKDNAVFINTGRGKQVVEADLARALAERPDRAAVLDVTWPEPPEKGHPFYAMDNVFLTPHIAGSAGDEVARMGEYMADEYRRFSAGQPVLYEVTEEKLKTMA